MKLLAYLKLHQIPRDDFAKEVGIHRTSMYRICMGMGMPRPATIRKIAKLTEGAVTANDFMSNGTYRSINQNS